MGTIFSGREKIVKHISGNIPVLELANASSVENELQGRIYGKPPEFYVLLWALYRLGLSPENSVNFFDTDEKSPAPNP
jgi:hypothetical protein